MFGQYLSTEVMNTLIERPSALGLGGERRKVAIMMTDLRGFTALAERLEPEKVVQILNAYFEVMIDVILEYHGTINEIMGDALLVIFGAPDEIPDQTQRAVACAIAMQNAMAQVNGENRAKDLPDLEMGIGINEDEVVIGNIGSAKRSSYTAIGNGVNMASRIESYTVGGQVLVSESVKKSIGGLLRIDGKREVFAKGADAPIQIYDVGGIAGRYHLTLMEKDTDLITLVRPIPLLCHVIGGKHVNQAGFSSSVIRLSDKGAELKLNHSVDILTNLKMNLKDVPTDLARKDFYGKVISRSSEDDSKYIVRFTATAPEVIAYLVAHRQFAGQTPGP